MAQVERQNEERKSKGKGRRTSRGTAEKASLVQCSPPLLHAAIHWLIEAGAAIRFGKTSDGGALAFGFYDGSYKGNEYLRPGDDVDEFLLTIIEDYATPDVANEWRQWKRQLDLNSR